MISIIIPYYNKISTIHRSVESVLNQTYTNWELIIIDDRSKLPLDKVFYTDDKRIQILVNHQNLGPGPTRQRGLDIAKGEYVAFLDADDWWDNQFLEISLGLFNENTTAVWSRTEMITDNGKFLKRYNNIGHRSIQKYLINFGHVICTSAFVWNRKYIPTWSELSTQQDSMFELEASVNYDRITPTNLKLVYQDKRGDEHREKYVKTVKNLNNKFLVYKKIKELTEVSFINKLRLFLWYYRIYLQLERLKAKEANDVKNYILINYPYFESYIWFSLNRIIHVFGIKVKFGETTINNFD